MNDSLRVLSAPEGRSLTADVVIVGSGAGSSAVAGSARRRGLSVIMLEAGEALTPEPGIHLRNVMPDGEFNRLAQSLLVPHAGGEVALDGLPGMRGIHALGGMLTSWSHAVPRPHLSAEWDGPIAGDVLAGYLGRAEELLWATDSLFGDGGPRQVWVGERIATRTGIPPRRVPMAARRDSLGFVEYSGAAQLMSAGETSGQLTIVTGAIVRRVEHRNGTATSVTAVHRTGGEFSVSGAVVVVGAGAVGTPQLLFASGLRHPALGRYATDHVNVVSMVPLDADAPVAGHDDPAMALYVPVSEDRPFHTAILDLPSIAHTGVSMGDDSLSVTNFGTFGLTWATPIPLPEQTLVLGMGAGRLAPNWDAQKGQFVPVTEANLTLSFDHRVLDGGAAGRMLARIAALLASPEKL